MRASNRQNPGNLRVERGGQAGEVRKPRTGPRQRRPITFAERQLDRELATLFAVTHGANGRLPNKSFYETAEGRIFPGREIGKRLVEMRQAGTPYEVARRIAVSILRFVDRLWDRPMDWPDRAA